MFGFKRQVQTAVADRRRHVRHDVLDLQPPGVLLVDHGGEVLQDVQILNISKQGVALSSSKAVPTGERLIFSVAENRAPIHCEVLACEPFDDRYRLRCRCIMGGFDVPA